MRITLTIIALLSALLISSVASAHPDVDIEVGFESIEVEKYKDELTLIYSIDSADWRRLDRAGVTPRVHIYAPTHRCGGQALHSNVELTARATSIDLPRHRCADRLTTVRIQLASDHERPSGRSVNLGGNLRTMNEISIQSVTPREYDRSRERRARDRRYDDRRYDDRRYDDRRTRERRSTQRDRRYDDRRRSQERRRTDDRRRQDQRRRGDRSHRDQGVDRAALVDACSEASITDPERDDCISKGNRIYAEYAADAIRACADKAQFSSNFLTCVDLAAQFRVNPTPSIEACGEYTNFGGHFEDCLGAAAPYFDDASPVIRSCGQTTSFSGQVADCISAARR